MLNQKRILFLGVGGAGMAPLALWCSKHSTNLCGYDDFLKQEISVLLHNSGVEVLQILLPEDLQSFDLVVYSNAFQSDHEILNEAKRLNIQCLRRGEFLAQIAKDKKLIAIVGSHGKTSTCALMAFLIHKFDRKINYILGGFFNATLAPAYACDSDWLLAEIDESDGSINAFNPEITLLLNVDWDHADYYRDLGALTSVFKALLERTREKVFAEQSLIESLALESSLLQRCEFVVPAWVQDREALKVSQEGNRLLDASFNLLNQSFALAVCGHLGFYSSLEEDVFAEFPGVMRRQNLLINEANLKVYEDYAHHPFEIAHLIESARKHYQDYELVLVFQPHRYSRTKSLNQDFAQTLSASDRLFLLPVYSAFENELEGAHSEHLSASFNSDSVSLIELNKTGLMEIRDSLDLNKPTLVLFIGAGTINEYAKIFASMYASSSIELAWIDYVKERVSRECVLKLEEPLSAKTTFKIGGSARFYAEPASVSDLLALFQSAQFFELDTFCLGRGSNVLVSDSGFDGLVLRFNQKCWRDIKPIGENFLWVGCGVRLKELCGYVAQLGYSGFEFLEGIPGTVGGALRMNAGAMGKWTFDLVERVVMIDSEGSIRDIPRSEFSVEYRKVKEIANGIALGAVLQLGVEVTSQSVRSKMDSYADVRKGSQPIAPSAGCIFKNPNGNYAGRLIDSLGLKGASVGQAEVSDVHGNFIINRGGSTAAEVQSLVRIIREKVKSESGYVLEPEVLLLGESWDVVLNDSKEDEAAR